MKKRNKKVALMPTYNKLIGLIITIIIAANLYGYMVVYRGFLLQDMVKYPPVSSVVGLISIVIGILFIYSLYLKEAYNIEYFKDKTSKIFAFLFLVTTTTVILNQKYLILKDLNIGFLPVTSLDYIVNLIPFIIILLFIVDIIYLIFSKNKKNAKKQYIIVAGLLGFYVIYSLVVFILNLNLELPITLIEFLFYGGLTLILVDDIIGYIFMFIAQIVGVFIFVLPSNNIKSIMSFREIVMKLNESQIPLQGYTYVRYYTEHVSIIVAFVIMAIILIRIIFLKNQYK